MAGIHSVGFVRHERDHGVTREGLILIPVRLDFDLLEVEQLDQLLDSAPVALER